jgi:4-amino-4-deoxy-L-arabinose transferase-like glycosyltransferase
VSRALRAGLVAAILVAALGLRVTAVQRTNSAYRPINDAGSYLKLASEVAHTGDYSLSREPGSGAGGTRGPSAYFAPGYPYFLAVVDLLDGHATPRGGAVHPARLAQPILGTVTVALGGLIALELFGPLAGLIALLLAAVFPVGIELATVLVAENVLTPLVLGAVYAALRVRRARNATAAYGWIAATGVLTGLATLTHENAVLIALPLLAAVWTRKPRLTRRSIAAPALLLAVTVLTILPWTIRNAVVMHRFIPVSDETGITLVGTYNAASAANPGVPYRWRLYYAVPGERSLIRDAPRLTEPQLGDKLQHQALHYIAEHPLSPLEAAYHNTRRLFELEGSFAWRSSAAGISLPTGLARLGVVGLWIMCLLAVAGAFSRPVRTAPKWVWLVPLLLALSVVLVNVETPRFRGPVDPFLILLAAAGVSSAAERVRAWLGNRAPVRGETRDPVATRPGELVEMRERLA